MFFALIVSIKLFSDGGERMDFRFHQSFPYFAAAVMSAFGGSWLAALFRVSSRYPKVALLTSMIFAVSILIIDSHRSDTECALTVLTVIWLMIVWLILFASTLAYSWAFDRFQEVIHE
jgi:hypothetical protein